MDTRNNDKLQQNMGPGIAVKRLGLIFCPFGGDSIGT